MYFRYKMPHEEHGSRMTKICILFSDVPYSLCPFYSPRQESYPSAFAPNDEHALPAHYAAHCVVQTSRE
jgi:hypothetical protein